MRGCFVHLKCQLEVLSMNRIINLANKSLSLNIINKIKNKDYVPFDLKITNIHIMSLNEKIGFVVFRKDSLYINSHSLWELMQPIGNKKGHNYHELNQEDVYMALSSIEDPFIVINEGNNRYSIASILTSHFGVSLLVVVEIDAPLISNKKAKINKIVAIYPKRNIEK